MNDSETYFDSICVYNDASAKVKELYAIEGNNELFNKAYFQNEPELLQNHFDSLCGEGFYAKLCEQFDIASSKDVDDVERGKALTKLQDMIDAYKNN